MRVNRSAPWAQIVPVLRVDDVRAAVAWYVEVFGLVEHVRIGETHRAQLGLPGATAELVVAESRGDRGVGDASHQVMLKVDDVDAVLEAARAAGADADPESHDWEYGERQAGLVDPFGHAWVLTQTLRDVDPADWGGRTVAPRGSGAGAAVGLFAGVPVSDYATAAAWYELLLGAVPSFHPNEVEAVWELADQRYVYIVEDPERAGGAVSMIWVDDPVAEAARIAERGLEPVDVEKYDGVWKYVFHDRDGNEIGVGGRVAGGDADGGISPSAAPGPA